jgi:NTE family protein
MPPVDVALPRDFAARYGDGVERGLCLGGGGLFFIAWQTAYLHTLASEGFDAGTADRIVGTSAGSLVATALVGGRLPRIYRGVSALAKVSSVFPTLGSNSSLHPSQQRALDIFFQSGDSDPATLRAIGHASLAARTSSSQNLRRTLGAIIGGGHWPSKALQITCVDAYTGERCVLTSESNIQVSKAIAASCAVPGLSAPQPIGDRRCLDGGVSGTGTHLDLLAATRRVLVLALSDGSGLTEGMATQAPGAAQQELADLAASGTDVLLRTPEEFDVDELMVPASVPRALAMGKRQAAADAAALSEFWD